MSIVAPRSSGGAASVPARLVQLVAVVAIPLIVLSAGALWFAQSSEQKLQEAALLGRAQAAAAMIDREFDMAQKALGILASSTALARNDLDAFDVEMRHASTDFAGATINLTASSGEVTLTTFWPPGSRKSGVRASAFTLGVLNANRPAVSDLVISPQSKLPHLGVANPVRPGVPGTPAWVLSLCFPANGLAQALESLHLPPGWLASVSDRNNHIVARTRNQDAFIGRSPSLDMVRATKEADSGIVGNGHRSADGVPTLSAFARAPVSGYIAAIGIPESDFTGPLRFRLLQTMAIAALLTGLGIGGALLLARKIVVALEAVVKAAQGTVATTGLREINHMAQAIATAEAALHDSEVMLREMNRTLEVRVQDEVVAREKAQTRAVQAERVQALGLLASGIAHDFNNVLQAVQGAAALIEESGPGDSEDVYRYARMITDAGARGAAITGRLLAFARKRDLRPESIDPAAFLTGMRDVLAYALGAGITIRVEADAGLPKLLADKGSLETVIINLAQNAGHAMGGTGILNVTARVHIAPEGLGIGPPDVLKAGIYVCLSVSDTGCGMNSATLARVSEPFFTTKSQGQGTGLGLALARGFTEQSGGGLHIESEPGQGTVIRLWLPATAEQAGALALLRHGPTTGLPRKAAARLLLVDDDAMVLRTLALQLARDGYFVLPASSGLIALALLDADEVVDLIVSDFSMSEMNGMVLISEAQRRRPGLPGILLTGFSNDAAEIAVSSTLPGAVSLLYKPITAAALAHHVAVALQTPKSLVFLASTT